MMAQQHEMLEDGESAEKWAIRQPGFLGSIKQLLNCARCGDGVGGGWNKPKHVYNIFKPTMHILCDDCHEALPE